MGLAGDAVPAATMCSVFVFTCTTATTSARAVAAEVSGRATDAARADEWVWRRTIPGRFGRCTTLPCSVPQLL
ncbi:hypothetical protein EDB89DRAFT_2013984 [Lactarius sanguifluus]|nr:hypothetical protein EDB89DRAFT_2013984 [Lactarius sanguifluus]